MSHGRECEMGQFHPRVHMYKSEMRLAEFLMITNVNPRMELFHVTFLTISYYLLSFCLLSFDHCIICRSPIYDFWLPLWYRYVFTWLWLNPCTVPIFVFAEYIFLLFSEDNTNMNWCLKQICILTDIHSGTTSECPTRCRGSCISLELLTFLRETVCIIMVRYLYNYGKIFVYYYCIYLWRWLSIAWESDESSIYTVSS